MNTKKIHKFCKKIKLSPYPDYFSEYKIWKKTVNDTNFFPNNISGDLTSYEEMEGKDDEFGYADCFEKYNLNNNTLEEVTVIYRTDGYNYWTWREQDPHKYNNIIRYKIWKEQQIKSKQITSANKLLYEDIAKIICQYT